MGPYETKVIVLGPLPAGVGAAEPSFTAGTTVAELDGDWSLNLNGKQMTTPLKSWEDLGATASAGPATYRRQFTAQKTPAGKHVYLEIGDVHDYAKVTLNGKDLGARAWGPYRWDDTSALKPGANELVIEVSATAAGGRGGGGAPATAAPVGDAGSACGRSGCAAAPAARRRGGERLGAAGAPAPAAAPAGGGAGRGAPTGPAVSGLLSPVRLVAH